MNQVSKQANVEIREAPSGKGWRLTAEQELPCPLAEVFEFFSAAENLEELTPDWMEFRLETPAPIEMAEGLRIDYRLKVRHIPLKWQSLISVWDPPHRFVDEQTRGPYSWWHHTHSFESLDENRTLVRDVVDYGVPGGSLVHKTLVRPDLLKIFEYRHQVLTKRFGTP